MDKTELKIFHIAGITELYKNDLIEKLKKLKMFVICDLDQETDNRSVLCEDKLPYPPYCFKGRVKDELNFSDKLFLEEITRYVPCQLSFGSGYYWNYDLKNIVDSLMI